MADHELLQHARRGNPKGVRKALEKGALIEARRPLAMRPRDYVKGSSPKGLEANECEQTGMTPLMYAAQSGCVECVRLLLEYGAHVNAVDEDLWSSLHFAAKEGHIKACEKLLENRAEHRLDSVFLRELQKAIGERQSSTRL
eukprot:UN2462